MWLASLDKHLVTADGHEVLTSGAPKHVEAIEAARGHLLEDRARA